jgi:hypothetical protein
MPAVTILRDAWHGQTEIDIRITIRLVTMACPLKRFQKRSATDWLPMGIAPTWMYSSKEYLFQLVLLIALSSGR